MKLKTCLVGSVDDVGDVKENGFQKRETGGIQLALVSWHVPFDPATLAEATHHINQESEPTDGAQSLERPSQPRQKEIK